jgi:murein L,D-transpeptidase YafK
MTPLNMARHRNSPHLAFWNELKEGYDHFEVTRKEPKVAVCDKHYVFDGQSSGKFNPVDRCPAYKMPQQIAAAGGTGARLALVGHDQVRRHFLQP